MRVPALLVCLVSASACTASGSCRTDDAPASTSASTASIAASTPAPIADKPRGDDEVHSVYPTNDKTPADPLVVKYCEAVMGRPEARRVECCPSPSFPRVAECERTLGYAFRTGAVKLDPAAVDACKAAMETATEGCDWVGGPAPFPQACDGIIAGTIASDAACRSSLECQGELRCLGVSAIDLGKCGPPHADRFVCNASIDVLASGTGQVDFADVHRECEGVCKRRQCAPALTIGAACKDNAECGKAHCIQGVCADKPLPRAGEPCAAEQCASGLRCANEKCAAPKKEGEACAVNGECRGTCVKNDGGAEGKCATACPVLRLPEQHPGKPTGTVPPGGRPPPR